MAFAANNSENQCKFRGWQGQCRSPSRVRVSAPAQQDRKAALPRSTINSSRCCIVSGAVQFHYKEAVAAEILASQEFPIPEPPWTLRDLLRPPAHSVTRNCQPWPRRRIKCGSRARSAASRFRATGFALVLRKTQRRFRHLKTSSARGYRQPHPPFPLLKSGPRVWQHPSGKRSVSYWRS